MKSDREFLDGIYAKAEKLSSSNSVLYDRIEFDEMDNRRNRNSYTRSTGHLKFAGVFVALLVVLTSTINTNAPTNTKPSVDPRNVPRTANMMEYSDQLSEEATDIIEVKAKPQNDRITLGIVDSYKGTKSDSDLSNLLNNEVLSLTVNQSAIVFIDADSQDMKIMDIFVWNSDKNCFMNPYGETITREILIIPN